MILPEVHAIALPFPWEKRHLDSGNLDHLMIFERMRLSVEPPSIHRRKTRSRNVRNGSASAESAGRAASLQFQERIRRRRRLLVAGKRAPIETARRYKEKKKHLRCIGTGLE